MKSRREFLLKSMLAGIGISFLGKKALNAAPNDSFIDFQQQSPGPYTLPALPYAYDALEPYIDLQTMQIHHTKHHQAYVTNLNKALESVKDAPNTLEGLLAGVSKLPMAVRNNAGGHWNHSLFWSLMQPVASTATANVPAGKLADAINSTFGSFDKFKELFANAGKDRFGSGWAWLVVQNGKLVIGSTPNQDNPLMDISELKGTPVLALDVWEHAYYLKYQNRRPDYMAAWWSIVNWQKASELFEKAK
jgi:Fe-Mn family superoxide dismutase